MSSEIKTEDESSLESADNLEVRRSTSAPLQTYRPHKRAQSTDHSRVIKVPRVEESENVSPEVSENSQSSSTQRHNSTSNNSLRSRPNVYIDPEIVVISDSEDDDIASEVAPSNTTGRRENETHGQVRNIEYRFDPNEQALHPRIVSQQRMMWFRQQAEAENRRRHATPNGERLVPYTTEVVNLFTSGNTFYRIQIGPPIMQTTVEARLVREVQEERQRICFAKTVINRYTVLYSFMESNTDNHEQKTCVVCITEFQNGQDVRRLPCMHIFHKECVDKWIIQSMRCPICRYAIINDEDF